MSDLILITGASSDIGMALMRALLLTTDARILAHGFRGTERFAALTADFGTRVTALQADLSQPQEIASFAEQVLAQGTPEGVVHLPAEKLSYERFTKLKWEALERDLMIQLGSAIHLLQRLLPKMTKLPSARVVFVLSSVVHGMPPKFMSQYTVIKYAQLGLMRALAAEYSATGVRINAVSPSMVDTQFLTNLNKLSVEAASAGSPLGRNALPADVIGAIQFLLSPAAEYITGITIPITAGSIL